jgi:spore germination protein
MGMTLRKARARSRALAAAAILLAACAPSETPSPPTPQKKTDRVVLAYYADYLGSAGYAAVTSYTDYLSDVSVDSFTVTADGAIAGQAPADLLAFDQGHAIRNYACVSNYGEEDFDPVLAHRAIVSNRAPVIANLTALARNKGWAGINIDFENLYPADRAAFSRFIRELAASLHGQGLKLAISVPAKSANDPEDDWSWPFDYASLGADADLVQMMTYDENGPWGDPGPVAGYDWMEGCVQYAVTAIDPAKLLIGLPAYGYDWNLDAPDGSTDFAWKDVADILARTGAVPAWDSRSLSAHIAYTNTIGTQDGSAHVAWYETPEGIAAKSALVRRYRLAGLSMWVLGDEDLCFWQAVAAGLK